MIDSRGFEHELEVFVLDDLMMHHLELSIENGLGKSLPPWPGPGQGLGNPELNLTRVENPVTVNGTFQIVVRQVIADLFIEGLREGLKIACKDSLAKH